jgi:hypothetical protein
LVSGKQSLHTGGRRGGIAAQDPPLSLSSLFHLRARQQSRVRLCPPPATLEGRETVAGTHAKRDEGRKRNESFIFFPLFSGRGARGRGRQGKAGVVGGSGGARRGVSIGGLSASLSFLSLMVGGCCSVSVWRQWSGEGGGEGVGRIEAAAAAPRGAKKKKGCPRSCSPRSLRRPRRGGGEQKGVESRPSLSPAQNAARVSLCLCLALSPTSPALSLSLPS